MSEVEVEETMSETTDRWAAVEIMGHRQHVGRIREVRFAGVDMLEIEALERDGSTKILRYGGSAVFSMRYVSEEEARRALLPKAWNPCDTFTASPVLATGCADCGFTREEHDAHAAKVAQRALPAALEEDSDEDEMVDEEDPDPQSACEAMRTAILFFTVKSPDEPSVEQKMAALQRTTDPRVWPQDAKTQDLLAGVNIALDGLIGDYRAAAERLRAAASEYFGGEDFTTGEWSGPEVCEVDPFADEMRNLARQSAPT